MRKPEKPSRHSKRSGFSKLSKSNHRRAIPAEPRIGFHYCIKPGEVLALDTGLVVAPKPGVYAYVRHIKNGFCHIWTERIGRAD